jgi:hypothetical protein
MAIRRPEDEMRKNYDFSSAARNPYAKRLKRQLTIRLDEETITLLSGTFPRDVSAVPDTHEHVPSRLCRDAEAASLG